MNNQLINRKKYRRFLDAVIKDQRIFQFTQTYSPIELSEATQCMFTAGHYSFCYIIFYTNRKQRQYKQQSPIVAAI